VVPFVKPVNVQERLVVFVHDAGAVTAGDEATVYPVIALPPLDPGALQLTTEDASAAVPETFVGAPGAVGAATETSLVAIDGDEAPLAFVATTTNLYVPFAKPLTVQVVAVVVVHVERPGNAVTVYPVIALPPLGGAVQLTVAELVELTPVGGCGA
jgi:hypothetical protein